MTNRVVLSSPAIEPAAVSAFAFLDRDDHQEPSVFRPHNLLREARRQRNLPAGAVPSLCLLDPDGDIVEIDWAGHRIGIVGCAVGAPFAVLVAEQLFASGCDLLLSITSAGRIADDLPRSCIIVIDKALRGDGTSLAYLPPSPWIEADPALIAGVRQDLDAAGIATVHGATWTTDAPYRETQTALARAAAAGVLAVEMETAALYAFARVHARPVVCFAQVTNELAVNDGDFEKGPAAGAEAALALVAAVATGWCHRREEQR